MRILSFDWATKKALTYYDSKTEKVKEIPNAIEAFEGFFEKLDGKKATMLFEFGGGDTFKIMAYRAGHSVLQVPGKKIKDFRDSKGEEKSDENDARLIYEYYIENNGGGASFGLPKNVMQRLPLSTKTKGEGAISDMRNSTSPLPSPFYPFQETDADIAEIKILFREHEDLKKDMVREKLKKIAFELKFRIASVSGDRIKKMLFHKNAVTAAKERDVELIKKTLKEKVAKFNVWNNYYKDMKGAGSTIISGLIGELGGRQFESDESLKHYCGMVPKKEFTNYNRYVKAILFQFVEQIIKQRTPEWRELYDNMKIYYAEKHADWSKGKVNAYAMKFIETKLVIDFWNKWQEMGC